MMDFIEKDKKTKPQENKLIIWAVDPFTDEAAVLQSAAWCIRALAKSRTSTVAPVYLWKRTTFDWPARKGPEFLETLRQKGQDEIEKILLRVKIPGILPLRVLSDSTSRGRDQVCNLLTFAKDAGSELIVVSSRGRKGPKRWILGSFAETLALRSDVPILIVHPHWTRTPEFNTVLYPTDLSLTSTEAFDRVLDFAERHGSRIVIFHKISPELYPSFNFALPANDAYEEVVAAETEAAELAAEQLARLARSRGVPVEVIFDRSRRKSVAESILRQARRLESVVALASQSEPVLGLLLGSTTRRVVRQSEQPVWVIHPTGKDREGRVGLTPQAGSIGLERDRGIRKNKHSA